MEKKEIPCCEENLIHQDTVEQVRACVRGETNLKERAAQMAAALQRAAEEGGISLKLNKKPKEK